MSAAPTHWLTSDQAARRLAIAPRTVRAWCARGVIPGAERHGRDWAIPAHRLAEVRRPLMGNPNHRT